MPVWMTALGVPVVAEAADDVAIAPIIDDGAVPPRALETIDAALAEVVVLSGEWEAVVELTEVPESLNPVCLELEGCLYRIAQDAGTVAVIAGMVASRKDAYVLDLVLAESGVITRRRRVDLPLQPDPFEAEARAAAAAFLGVPNVALPAARPSSGGGERITTEPRRERRPRREPGGDPRVSLVGRAGWSAFYTLDFLALGGELRVRASPSVQLVAGADVFVVRRLLEGEDGEEARRLGAMVPVSLGALFRRDLGAVAPYVGAEAIAAKYNETTPVPALGARARAGLDLQVSPSVGLTLDLSAGLWGAERWNRIEDGVRQVGVLPGARAGVVVGL